MVYQVLLIFLLIITVLAFLWFIPLDIQVYYRKEWQHHRVSAILRVLGGRAGLTWGPFTYQWEIKELFVSRASTSLVEANLETWKDRLQELQKLKELEPLKEVFYGFRVKELRWYTDIGLKDPALTAVSVGAVWAIKEWLWSAMHSRIKVDMSSNKSRSMPVFGVHPSFERPGLRIDFFCRLGATTGKMAVPLIRYYLNSRKINPVDTMRKNWRAFRANYL